MPQKWNTNEIKIKLNKIEYKIIKFVKDCWPINWSKFKEPKIVFKVLLSTSYAFKAFLVTILFAFLVSVGFLGYSSYLVLTTEVAAKGGAIREGFVGSEINVFNPVLELNNSVETRISSLLFHPLYEVIYPDFLNSNDEPKINPILLAKPPEWLDYNNENPENRFRLLKFTLKEDIRWSDGSKITLDDIEYTIERLKEDRGNILFRDTLKRLEFERLSDREFLFRSPTPDPQLIYNLNFRPISQNYFSFLTTPQLLVDNRSRKPTVTSGFFRFSVGQVQNPNTTRTEMVDNPIRDENGRNAIVVLERNPIQNYGKEVLLDKYILTRYDNLLAIPNQNNSSLEKASLLKNVDFYTRSLTSNVASDLTPENVQKSIKLNQQVVPTNIYYTAFFNTELGIRQNYTGFLVNKSLRNYITCYLLEYEPHSNLRPFVDIITPDKRIVPPHFNTSYLPNNCNNRVENLDEFYSISIDERTGIKRVLLSGNEIRLILLGVSESNQLLTDLQLYFRDEIGIPVELITDPAEVSRRLESRQYNIAFLPIKITNRDPITLFGQGFKNYSGLNLNNRIEKFDVNNNLLRYSKSNLKDTESKNTLIDFFKQEMVAVSLYRAKQEYNYSDKAVTMSQNIPEISTFVEDIYLNANHWFVETRREWWWSVKK